MTQPISSKFTLAEKRDAIERELRLRRRVYPKLIERGRLRSSEASIQIAIFEAILTDLVEAIAGSEPTLFNRREPK